MVRTVGKHTLTKVVTAGDEFALRVPLNASFIASFAPKAKINFIVERSFG